MICGSSVSGPLATSGFTELAPCPSLTLIRQHCHAGSDHAIALHPRRNRYLLLAAFGRLDLLRKGGRFVPKLVTPLGLEVQGAAREFQETLVVVDQRLDQRLPVCRIRRAVVALEVGQRQLRAPLQILPITQYARGFERPPLRELLAKSQRIQDVRSVACA